MDSAKHCTRSLTHSLAITVISYLNFVAVVPLSVAKGAVKDTQISPSDLSDRLSVC